MNNTLYTNDVILVNKLRYGPKLPSSPLEIPLVDLLYYLNMYHNSNNTWKYNRLKGTRTIKKGDVLVFKIDFYNHYVKRCMGVPGDTVELKNRQVYINNNHFQFSDLILHSYSFKVDKKNAFNKVIDSLGIQVSNIEGKITADLSDKDLKMLKKLTIISDIVNSQDTLKTKIFPKINSNKWTIDNYGPYIIPKKGMSINLTKENYALYEQLIREQEDVHIKNVNDSYFIDDKEVNTYTFKQNYYFMLGDNRNNSSDSRSWGLLPEMKIIGKVEYVLWSTYKDAFQWKRIFKKV